MSNKGMKITKTDTFLNYLILQDDDYDGEAVWVSGSNQWTCDLYDSEVHGNMVTEEDGKDKISLKFLPIGVEDVKPQWWRASPKRLSFMSRSSMGLPPDPEVYDWIAENNNGETMVIETCGSASLAP